MYCVQGTTCFEFFKLAPTALIALIVAGITFGQWRVARAKLKLDLFDRRYKIFHQTWAALSGTVMRGTREKNLADLHAYDSEEYQSKYAEKKSALMQWFDTHDRDVKKLFDRAPVRGV
jgi:hypothetical protein